MSDTKKRRSSRLPTGDALFDAAWKEILARIEEGDDESSMTVGTVRGSRTGGKVRVRVDDEDEDRELGFTSSTGVDYQNGDRVALGKNKAGEFVILSNLANRDAAITGAQLASGSITKSHFAKGMTFDKSDLSQNVQSSLTKADKAVQQSGLKDYVKSSALSSYAQKDSVPTKTEFDRLKADVDALKHKSGKKDKKA